jgi:membrane protein DedA with SNARE-associated domain
MTLFQGSTDTFWLIVAAIASVLICAATWYMVIVGRDRPPQRLRRSEERTERFGDIEEDRSPIPKFLTYAYVGIAIWSVGYLIWTGVEGVTGYK